jgi:hypothetical protein
MGGVVVVVVQVLGHPSPPPRCSPLPPCKQSLTAVVWGAAVVVVMVVVVLGVLGIVRAVVPVPVVVPIPVVVPVVLVVVPVPVVFPVVSVVVPVVSVVIPVVVPVPVVPVPVPVVIPLLPVSTPQAAAHGGGSGCCWGRRCPRCPGRPAVRAVVPIVIVPVCVRPSSYSTPQAVAREAGCGWCRLGALGLVSVWLGVLGWVSRDVAQRWGCVPAYVTLMVPPGILPVLLDLIGTPHIPYRQGGGGLARASLGEGSQASYVVTSRSEPEKERKQSVSYENTKQNKENAPMAQTTQSSFGPR